MSTYAGVGAGSFGALGGSITFEWIPDPNVIASRIMSLAGYLENFQPPLQASQAIARADMQRHFDTESGPGGEAWAPLNEEYVIHKRGGAAHPILQLSGALHDGAVSESAWPIDGNDLFFNTGGLPFYWIFHETGREGIGGMEEFRKAIEQQFGRGVEIDMGAAGGMPARPFVGISFEAELQILEVFDAWFAGAVSGFYASKSGTVQRRGAGGRFGAAIRGGG